MSAYRLLQGLARCPSLVNNHVNGVGKLTNQLQKQSVACISTSKKSRDTTITADHESTAIPTPKTVEDFANPSKKNYQTYGFCSDPDWDINIKNYLMFWAVTVSLVCGSFVLTFKPETRLKDWTQREAYIELARREALGLPLVDPNLVPPENVHLPSEEELGDFEIII